VSSLVCIFLLRCVPQLVCHNTDVTFAVDPNSPVPADDCYGWDATSGSNDPTVELADLNAQGGAFASIVGNQWTFPGQG
jgi:hypothetical protein